MSKGPFGFLSSQSNSCSAQFSKTCFSPYPGNVSAKLGSNHFTGFREKVILKMKGQTQAEKL